MATPNLALVELTHNEYNGEVTHNDALGDLDFFAQPIVIAHTTSAEPGSPTNGDAYILPTGCTGTNWSGNDKDIGHYINGAWKLYTPKEGWFVKSKEDDNIYVFDGTNWNVATVTIVSSVSSGPYNSPDYDQVILVDTTSAAITVNLPTPRANVIKTIKKVAGGNDVTVDTPGSETIDGSATQTISTTYESITVVSDGTNWFII